MNKSPMSFIKKISRIQKIRNLSPIKKYKKAALIPIKKPKQEHHNLIMGSSL